MPCWLLYIDYWAESDVERRHSVLFWKWMQWMDSNRTARLFIPLLPFRNNSLPANANGPQMNYLHSRPLVNNTRKLLTTIASVALYLDSFANQLQFTSESSRCEFLTKQNNCNCIGFNRRLLSLKKKKNLINLKI